MESAFSTYGRPVRYRLSPVRIGEADDCHWRTGEPAPARCTARIPLIARMRDRVNVVYAEAAPLPKIRQQNPHMHPAEACLSLHKLSEGGIPPVRDRRPDSRPASPPSGGLLGEAVCCDLGIPQGRDAEIVSWTPFEWVWLLHAYATRVRSMPVPAAAGHPYACACATLDADDGRARK